MLFENRLLKKKRKLYRMLDDLIYQRKNCDQQEKKFYTRQIKLIMDKIEGK